MSTIINQQSTIIKPIINTKFIMVGYSKSMIEYNFDSEFENRTTRAIRYGISLILFSDAKIAFYVEKIIQRINIQFKLAS